ncbi:MAG: glycosyltransferase family 4 protein [Candidatus Buchananbacteria bacterium]|nr:glycosyltransferase family 4 protein [Candidatus Buchananbacteria bacterium]
MKVLMISIDRGLLGTNQLGDVIERHAKYGHSVEKLDILIFTLKGNKPYQISKNVTAYPTNSNAKLLYGLDAKKVAQSLFEKNHYDLIVTQDPFITGLVGVLLKTKYKSKLLVHFHGDFWENRHWLKESKLNPLFLMISKFVVSRADGVRVMSEGQKEKLLKAGVDEKKIRVISTPVDLAKYQTNSQKQHDHPTVLHVSRYDEVKDFKTLASAWELVATHLPDVSFIQVGAGGRLREIFTDVLVKLIPRTNHHELVNFYYRSDVVVLSSTSESFGKVLVEANACGKPVVSTATTGAKEIIQDGYNGFLVPIGNAKALAEKIVELLKNPELAKTMGENGKKLVTEKFGDNTDKIINFWKEIIRV